MIPPIMFSEGQARGLRAARFDARRRHDRELESVILVQQPVRMQSPEAVRHALPARLRASRREHLVCQPAPKEQQIDFP